MLERPKNHSPHVPGDIELQELGLRDPPHISQFLFLGVGPADPILCVNQEVRHPPEVAINEDVFGTEVLEHEGICPDAHFLEKFTTGGCSGGLALLEFAARKTPTGFLFSRVVRN